MDARAAGLFATAEALPAGEVSGRALAHTGKQQSCDQERITPAVDAHATTALAAIARELGPRLMPVQRIWQGAPFSPHDTDAVEFVTVLGVARAPDDDEEIPF